MKKEREIDFECVMCGNRRVIKSPGDPNCVAGFVKCVWCRRCGKEMPHLRLKETEKRASRFDG
jgi:hypothetical protein